MTIFLIIPCIYFDFDLQKAGKEIKETISGERKEHIMGILSSNVNKIHEKQKKSLTSEASKAGLSPLEVIEIGNVNVGGKKAFSSSFKAVLGGKLAPDFFQVFLFSKEHLYIQPYSGITVLPGEHHIILDGSFKEPLVLSDEAIFGAPSWRAGNNRELTKQLQKEYPSLKKLAKKTAFEWAIGMGKIELEWAIQVLGLGKEKSHMIMQTGRYGGFTTYEVGFQHFSRMVREINKLLNGTGSAFHNPVFPVSYYSIARDILLGKTAEAEAGETPEKKSFHNFTDAIEKTAELYAGKKIHVGDYPEKKEDNVRSHIMPGSRERILALFDLTTFGSAKDAFVFCEDKVYIKNIDEQIIINYRDISSVGDLTGSLEDKLELELTTGPVKVPVESHGEELKAVFDAIVDSL